MIEKNDRGQNPFERVITHILQALIVGGLLWSVSTIQRLDKKAAVLQVQIESLSASVQAIASASGNRYTSDQAASDWTRVYEFINKLDERMTYLEHKKEREAKK